MAARPGLAMNRRIAENRSLWKPRPSAANRVQAPEVRGDFENYEGPEPRLGWVLNMLPTTLSVGDVAYDVSALELFLLDRDEGQFRVAIAYEPYFYVAPALRYERRAPEVRDYLANHPFGRRGEFLQGMRAELVDLDDLETPNHVAGRQRTYIKLLFRTVSDLMTAKRELQDIVRRNKPRIAALEASTSRDDAPSADDVLATLDEIREYDVPYYMRAAIDLDIRVGAWVEVKPVDDDEQQREAADQKKKKKKRRSTDDDDDDEEDDDAEKQKVASVSLASRFQAMWRREILEKPTPRVLAFDIECTKAALKFPNAEHDEVFMISYMADTTGYLIISRTVVSEDLADFQYAPTAKFKGDFTIFNEPDEKALLQRFIDHCRELKPHVYVTYNGDYFDWPFMKRRCQIHGLDIENALGIAAHGGQQTNQTAAANEDDDDQEDEAGKKKKNNIFSTAQQAEFRGVAGPVHLDAFYWVKRDSYLPQGSQGLKAVTKCKLGYDPVEVDPEDMVRFAAEEPQMMAEYSVSDAVATYYLYAIYVNLFIFSLCTVIPNGSEDVLRKGSGTLCESLLMVQAYQANVVAPNKQIDPYLMRHTDGRVVETETYVGGHVECLETGVFRSDLEYDFNVDPAAVQVLIDKVDRDVRFAIEVEAKASVDQCTNFDEVCTAIKKKLLALKETPSRQEPPFIYHLDVGAMYPNIILTNRLQPTAVVTREACASCDYNADAGGTCKRPMEWTWRGDLIAASGSDVAQVRRQLQYEIVDGHPYHELPEKERAGKLKARLKDYAQKVYKKTKAVAEEPRVDTVCMRENAFYIDTVRAFRDRRYEYKALVKTWKKQKVKAEAQNDEATRKAAEDKEQLFDSLQLAHKCILNSFYGYVMRKGARWRSMPMAGIVTLTGANLITQARELVEKLGRPLELDTDGIWCMLPSSFPENYDLELRKDDDTTRKVMLSYPCAMLNADVHENYTNHQYQTLVRKKDAAGRDRSYYATSSECSIFFEVDGPYRCMVLPASTEEGKLLKKRYAVFNHDGSLAELKGFELKRRGELELIKTFQSEIFEQFLQGDTLDSCYAAVARVANQWLDVLDTKGAGLEEEDLLDLISENRSMSKDVEEYEGRKMTSLTTARRLADFLGVDMLADKGLQCKLVIAAKPFGAPVTDRAIPTAIFATEPAVKRHYLRKWLKDNQLNGAVREILDWDYYRTRLDAVIRKIITIPAALQRIDNPVPRVKHPEWLRRIVSQRDDKMKQTSITDHFKKVDPAMAKKKKALQQQRTTTTTSVKSPTKNLLTESHKDNRRASLLDVEDCCDMTQQAPVTTFFSAAGGTASSQEHTTDVKRPPPQIRDGIPEWLADRKIRWRERRRRKKEQGHFQPQPQVSMMLKKKNKRDEDENAVPSSTTSPKAPKRQGTGVMDMLRQTKAALRQGVWRVLEIRETETPGEVHCYVVTELGHLHRVPVAVPRIFYVQVRNDEAAAAVVKVGGRKAPNWRTPLSTGVTKDIYELRFDERRFADNERALTTFLAHPGLDKAYELATPLWFRAVLTIGHYVRVAPQCNEKKTTDFDLDDLELAAAPASSSSTEPKVAFLYHSRCPRTGRAVVALFFFHRDNKDSDASGTAHRPSAVVAIADPKAKRSDRPPGLRRLYDMVARPDVVQQPEKPKKVPKVSRLQKLWSFDDDDDAEEDLEEEEEEEEDDEEEEEEETATPQEWAALKVLKGAVVKDEGSALGVASKALAEYAKERRGATVIVVQSGTPAALLRRSVPVLAEFPNVEMAAHDADGEYPALGWQTAATKRAMERLVRCPAWMTERWATARFANLPVGNLGDDALLRVADTAFARLLRNNRHLLWASESPQPDLGSGAIADDGDAQGNLTQLAGLEHLLLDDDFAPSTSMGNGSVGRHSSSRVVGATKKQSSDLNDLGHLDVPGTYRGACVELNIFGAAVNAVMVADQLDDDDSGDAMTAESLGDCEHSFRLLRTLVTAWLKDVQDDQSTYADALLVAFYKWIGARSSLLHFPDLRRLVVSLMKRVHTKLIAELQRLGMRVVHASFHKLVLATAKRDPKQAQDHLAFVAQTLAARPIFGYLQLVPHALYASLLFLDRHNYAAIQVLDHDDAVSPPEGETQPDGTQQEQRSRRRVIDDDDDDDEDMVARDDDEQMTDSGAKKKNDDAMEDDDEDEEQRRQEEEERRRQEEEARHDKFVSYWKLGHDLPELAQDYLAVLVGSFLHKPLQCIRQRQRERDGDRDAERAAVAAQRREKDDDDEAAVKKTTASLIKDYATEKLMAIVTEMQRSPSVYTATAPLAFVKLVCHVLSLDTTVEEEVRSLKRLLLMKLRVKEFAKEAAFRPPEAAVVLPDVICTFCNACADLDLSDPKTRSDDGGIRCEECGHAMDLLDLEMRVVAQVHDLATAYAASDLRCLKCRRVATGNLTGLCPCSGAYKIDVPAPKLAAYVKACTQVATDLHMPYLAEVCDRLEE